MSSYIFNIFQSFISPVVRFISHDYETNGLTKAKSGAVQPLQAGVIELDAQLNLINEYQERCKILPYITQEPDGLLITRNIESLSQGQSEHEMMWALDEIFSSVKRNGYTISATYNGINLMNLFFTMQDTEIFFRLTLLLQMVQENWMCLPALSF